MGMMLRAIIFSFLLGSLFFLSSAQTCAKYAFASNKVYSSCSNLPYLNSFLHWTRDPSSGTVQIAYRHTGIASSRWVAWAINPEAKGMIGSQALVAFQKSDGTMKAYTSQVSSYQTKLQEGDLAFPVSDLSATYANNEITIFATLKLPNNSSSLNQVWQEGPVSGDAPQIHATSGPNVNSMATLNLLSGQSGIATGGGGAGSSRLKKKNIHGVLNAVSWGIMMPLGVILARYLKVFKSADPAWFYLHAACQTSAYLIGIAGWATGLQLGSQSPGIQFTVHRSIGIVLFCLASLQVTALLMRPKKEHKYRLYWNVYHHTVGYSIIVLSIVNIFRGFDILNPEEKWERAYVGILVALAVVAVFLEVFTWILVIRRKKSAATEKMPHGTNGTNGYRGYGGRTQQGV